jgi:phage tail-like protein
MSLKNYRKEVTVEVLNMQATPVMAFILHRAWVSEIQALPEMDANANAVAISTLKIEYEGFTLADRPSEPTET